MIVLECSRNTSNITATVISMAESLIPTLTEGSTEQRVCCVICSYGVQ